MRRYKIVIGGETYDSAPNGAADPNALLVEMDVSVTSVDAPNNGSFVRIWGLGIDAISQTRNYYGKSIEVHGGMARGLPLAKPQQFGLLSKGVITQAYGNWEGVNQTLDLVFAPGGEGPCAGGPNPMPAKKNIVLNWKKDQELGPAIEAALRSGFPDWEIALNISEKIIAKEDQPAFFPNLYDLGHFVRRITQQMIGGHYPGVSIDASSGKFKVFDEPKGDNQIRFEDLIGMPTWIGPQTIQVKTVMRADIKIDQKITLPETFVNSSQSGAPVGSFQNQRMAFTGDWSVQSIRHVGNSRAPVGDAWVSIFECYSNALSTASTENCPTAEGGQ